jgi:hypothetical protein
MPDDLDALITKRLEWLFKPRQRSRLPSRLASAIGEYLDKPLQKRKQYEKAVRMEAIERDIRRDEASMRRNGRRRVKEAAHNKKAAKLGISRERLQQLRRDYRMYLADQAVETGKKN